MFHQLFHKIGIQFGLLGAQEQNKVHGLGADDRGVELMNVFKVHKDIVLWWVGVIMYGISWVWVGFGVVGHGIISH